jgi:pimeloyl-ACP methyl ester carboxylesterase
MAKRVRHDITMARDLYQNMYSTETVMIPGAGHGAPTSHPQEYVDIMVKPHLVRR